MSKLISDGSREELREQILSIDSVYEIDRDHNTRFLMPTYYLDRLVSFIQHREAEIYRRARLDELEKRKIVWQQR